MKTLIQNNVDHISRLGAVLKMEGVDTSKLFEWVRETNIALVLEPSFEELEDSAEAFFVRHKSVSSVYS